MPTTSEPARSGPRNPGRPASRHSRAARQERRDGVVPLVAVVGGCGGAGASTLAVCLAVTALRLGRRAVLFDADPLGGGLERLIATSTVSAPANSGPREREAWPHQPVPPRSDRAGRQAASADLALVTWGIHDGRRIPVAAMRDALRALRSTADLVVVDLPRVIDDSAQLALSEATHCLVVAPVSERAAVATARLLPKLAAVGPCPELVVRLPGRDDLTPDEFAELLNVPLAGVVKAGRGRHVASSDPLSRLGGRSADSLDRFSRHFLERCGIPRSGATGAGSAKVSA